MQIANKYESNITVGKGNQKVNGKSIMGIMMLAASKGSRITVRANGDDAKKAIEELEELLSGKGDEQSASKI